MGDFRDSFWLLGHRPPRICIFARSLRMKGLCKGKLKTSFLPANTIREAAGFYRSDEVRNIRMSRISFDDGYLTIRVEKSKTHQLRQGDEVVIALSSSSVCPVSLLKYYLNMLDINPHSTEFIFRSLVKTKSFHELIPEICKIRPLNEYELTGNVIFLRHESNGDWACSVHHGTR